MEQPSSLKSVLLKHRPFHPVVPFDAGRDKLLRLRFTADNTELTEELLSDTKRFSRYITEKLQAAGAKFGIGGYAENRTIYARSHLFGAVSPEQAGEEPRRFHLGTDIWGKPLTPVMAPLDGLVHSFAFHNTFGDYGAVALLSHRLEEQNFFTLYGHLSLNSIKSLHEGERIKKGDVFAETGIPQENGSWPPHLHFQIIKDLEGRTGDYPGVCKYSEKETYLANCPDPDLILQMMSYAVEE
jgi:peptidoglycan LD-endopeptidase LytH